MNLNEPGGENNYSLIQCWNPYQMLKAPMSRSSLFWAFSFNTLWQFDWYLFNWFIVRNSILRTKQNVMWNACWLLWEI